MNHFKYQRNASKHTCSMCANYCFSNIVFYQFQALRLLLRRPMILVEHLNMFSIPCSLLPANTKTNNMLGKASPPLPEHYVAGDHVHRAVLHHSLLGLVLSTIKGWCDQLSFLNNFCQFFRYLELIYLWCTLPIINSNGVSGQPSNTLHSVVMYAGIMFGFVIQTTQKPQTAFQWEGLPNSFISNQNSLYRTKELG